MKIRERKVKCANSKWRVTFNDIVDDQGNNVDDYLIVESVQPNVHNITGVAILPIVNGRVALLNIHRAALDESLWEIPRGFVDQGEPLSNAATRELREETGLDCAPEDLEYLGTMAPDASTFRARGALFVARNCRRVVKPSTRELGLIKLQMFSIDEVVSMAANSEIQDASSLVSFYRYCAAFGSSPWPEAAGGSP